MVNKLLRFHLLLILLFYVYKVNGKINSEVKSKSVNRGKFEINEIVLHSQNKFNNINDEYNCVNNVSKYKKVFQKLILVANLY